MTSDRIRSRSDVRPATFPVGRLRRTVDVVVAALALVTASPVLAVATVALVATDGRPVLYTQPRVGEGGRPFRLYKLRTMRVGSAGPEITSTSDARITPVGAVLRRTSLDELPQLWHVLRGQMTLVGPRPESIALASRYPAECRLVLQARPGLTGPAQLRYRERAATPPDDWPDAESWYLQVLVPLRTRADLDYLRNPTLTRTVGFLGMTALSVLGLAHPDRPVRAVDVVRPPHPFDVAESSSLTERFPVHPASIDPTGPVRPDMPSAQ